MQQQTCLWQQLQFVIQPLFVIDTPACVQICSQPVSNFTFFLRPLVWSSLSRHRRQGFFRVTESRRNCTHAVVHANVVLRRYNGCGVTSDRRPTLFQTLWINGEIKSTLKKQQHATSSCAYYNTQLGTDRRLWVEKNEPIGSLTRPLIDLLRIQTRHAYYLFG